MNTPILRVLNTYLSPHFKELKYYGAGSAAIQSPKAEDAMVSLKPLIKVRQTFNGIKTYGSELSTVSRRILQQLVAESHI